MLAVVRDILQQKIADEVDLHEVRAITHQPHGVRVCDQVEAMTYSVRTQQ